MSFLGRIVVGTTRHVNAWRASLTPHSITVKGKRATYFEGGRGRPLVLLHGLGDDRHSFVQSVSQLTRRFRVILPDLPAHGDSEGTVDEAGSISSLVDWLDAFLETLGIVTVAIGGNSMGGHVALSFAQQQPGRVVRLILANPAGVGMPPREIYTGFGTPLVDLDDLDRLLRRVFHDPPTVPAFVGFHLIGTINRIMPIHNEIARRLREEQGIALDALSRILIPTLVIWGNHDNVLRPSVVRALQMIPDHEVLTLNAGHSPQLEVPAAVAKAIAEFLNK